MPTQILWMAPAAALLIGYLLGSIPFGVILTRAAGAGDLRQIGSGNIGATNVLRTGRKGLAAATLLLDALKGAVAIWLVSRLFPGDEQLAAAGAFIGHCFPIWLRFRGGKGVATLMGIVLALYWPIGLVFAAVWLGLLATVRISSVAGMAAAVSAPVAAAAFGRFDLVALLIGLALIVVWKHGANIERLLAGTEPKVGRKGE
ncbi:glycerol-3-phosphate acyltransferase PlsY [Sphingomonas jinjuensis]|uniref:Glycerol-3-phosphate acyltransferase n=2 Tax=Sphingomonas jinjuensis TaxID=535907 RepID=A0A840F814_9SPHN|nr:glycerol-3-phosphate acyltransferase PlsY [Sphingomonas jinjuensis]